MQFIGSKHRHLLYTVECSHTLELQFLIEISHFPGCDKEDSVLTVRWWLHYSLRLFMIHLFRTKRSGFSSKISILSKKILIRLNVKVQNTRKCWTKIWLTHFCFSPKLKPARIKNSYLVFKRKSLELKWRWTTYVNACCRQFTSKPINFQIFSHFHVLELSLKLGFIPAFPKCFHFNQTQTEEMDILTFLP